MNFDFLEDYCCFDIECDIDPYKFVCASFKTPKDLCSVITDDNIGGRFNYYDTKIIVGHNLKFDLLKIWDDLQFQIWLKNGGRIWDTQLAEYILTAQEHKFASLRDIAVNKYGCNIRRKNIDDLLFKKMENNDYNKVSDLPLKLVIEDCENDVKDTEIIYLKQIEKAKELGMLPLIICQMESLLATTAMAYNKMYINMEIFKENKERIEQIEINEIISQIYHLLPDNLKEINLSSPQQLSVLFFGGYLKSKQDCPVLNQLGESILIKTGKNAGEVKTHKKIISTYYSGLGAIPYKDWNTKTGYYKTNENVLEILSRNKKNKVIAKIAELLLKHRKLEKLLNTYYTGFEKYIVNSFISPNLSHCGYGDDEDRKGGTVTGRLSSFKPNLQNIPRS